jgi:Asp-tRNA(Asn)/Glu-tRNA(Gln) amidotransferase A subunit family amidase
MAEDAAPPRDDLRALAAPGAGELSSVELMEAVIARTKAVDGRVRAFNSFDEADALSQARASDKRRSAGKGAGAPVGPSRESRSG